MDKDFEKQRILIAGKGISGSGAYEALTKAGAVCAYAEDVTDWEAFCADRIVVSPGIMPTQPVFDFARTHAIPLCGELEIGYALNDKPVIAVTGTNGKTTVTELIGQILKCAGYTPAVCGNIGESFARIACCGKYDYAVVEASSFQLATTIDFRPHVAVLTNISSDHLDWHGSMCAYAHAKLRIAAQQTEEDFFILSQDDIAIEHLKGFAPRAQVFYTSLHGAVRGAYVYGKKIYYGSEAVCDVDRVRMEGVHNLANALSAVCAAKSIGIPDAAIVSALTEFQPDAHRMHLVARHNGKSYYDDSKGTNIMASVRAAQSMTGSTCMLVGGSDKGYEYDELFRLLPACVVRIAAVGETAEKVMQAGKRNGFAAIAQFDDFAEAFRWANDGTEENVLLSPASASFDMFSSYVARGEAFERLVSDACEK